MPEENESTESGENKIDTSGGNYGFIKLCYGFVGAKKDTSKMTVNQVVEEFLRMKGVSSPKEYFAKEKENTYVKQRDEIINKKVEESPVTYEKRQSIEKPELQGTEKQIEYAKAIRREIMNELYNKIFEGRPDSFAHKIEKATDDEIAQMTESNAKYFSYGNPDLVPEKREAFKKKVIDTIKQINKLAELSRNSQASFWIEHSTKQEKNYMNSKFLNEVLGIDIKGYNGNSYGKRW